MEGKKVSNIWFQNIEGEQMIDIDGEKHHIVHSMIDQEHNFYDLTTKKMMAIIECKSLHYKWIPNTSKEIS